MENTVKHAFRAGQTLRICLSAKREDGRAVFVIQDNGTGMDHIMLEKNKKIFAGELSLDDENEHIGLYNSYKRLKYLYGNEAQIRVESEESEGTTFIITIPEERNTA